MPNQLLSNFIHRWPLSSAASARLVTVLLLAIAGWQAGVLAWQFYQPQQQSAAPQMATVNVERKGPAYQLRDIVAHHLFGPYSATKPQAQQPQKPSNAPKTRLQLTLHGVVASSNPAKALAVIGNRGKQNTYGLDETIEGTRATLAAVYPDRVIIRNAGREETLLFDPNAKPSRSQSQAGNPRVQKPRAKSANASERLEQIRQEVVDNPAALMTYIRLSQVKRDGKVVGYRVNPGKDRALFDSVGLEPNDLAVTLNGVDLTNDAEAAKLWPQLTQMTELNLVVDRQGQRHDIYIGF